MEFNGFQVFPCGNAVLSIENNALIVSEISDSGLDGVLIKVEGVDNYTVNFGALESIAQNNGVLKTSSLKRNSFGQVIPSFESFKWYDQETDKVIIGYNSNFLPANYRVFGKLDSETVFDLEKEVIGSPDPDFTPPAIPVLPIIGAVVAAAAVAVTIWAELHTKKTTTTTYNYDAQGNFTGSTVTVSEDPVPFEIEINGDVYTVTEFGVTYDVNIPDDLIGIPSIEAHPIAEQITGYNLSSFQITSIEAW